MAANARGNPARWWKGARSGGCRGRAPATLFVSPLRRFATASALGLFFLTSSGLVYVTRPARISALSETLLSKVLGGHVTVKHGRLSWSGTLLLSGVEVRTADPEPTPGSELPIFSAEQIEARFDWLSLLSGQLSATQLVAKVPVFRPIENRETGHWNYERLRPAAGGAKGPEKREPAAAAPARREIPLPVVIVQNARVEWSEVRNGRVLPTGETVIDGRLVPDPASPSTYRLQFAQTVPTGTGTAGGSTTAPATRESALAGGAGTLAPADNVGVQLTGTWDVANDVFIASTENVTISDALKRGMPKAARDWVEDHALSGRLSSMKISFSRQTGLTVSIGFDNVSMMFMVEPEQGIGMGEQRPAYPLSVENVRGAMVFSKNEKNDDTMKITDLRGQVLGYPFIANCTLKGTSFDAPLDMNIQFPGAVLGDRYPPLFMAFLTSQDLMQRIQPHGKVDMDVSLSRKATRGPIAVDGKIQCHDVRIRFAHLPYPLDHLNGLITLTEDSVTFHDVKARSDENEVTIAGTVGTVWSNPVIDFHVFSDHTIFDDRLGACLPAKFAEIWDMFAIRGSGGFDCRVTRSNALMDQPKVVVDVTVKEGTGYVKAMPYPFSNMGGKLHLEGDQTRIENLTATTGSDGSGKVTLNGLVLHPGGDVTNLRPELRIDADVPIEPRLLQALPEEFSGKLAAAELGGRIAFQGVVGQVRKPTTTAPSLIPAPPPQTAELGVEGTFRWMNGTLKTDMAGIPLVAKEIQAEAIVSAQGAGGRGGGGGGGDPAKVGATMAAAVRGGEVNGSGGAIDIRSFSGLVRVPGTETDDYLQVQTAGHLDLGTMTTALNLHVDGRNISLPRTPPSVLPADWRDTWANYSPKGKLDLLASFALRVDPREPGAPAATGPATQPAPAFTLDSYAVTVSPKGLTLTNKDWPEPVEALVGHVQVSPHFVEMTNMAAKVGVMDLAWGGSYDIGAGRWSFKGDVESRGIPVKWLDRLPDGVAASLDTRREGVTLSLHVGELTREAAGKPWAFHATLATSNMALTQPLALSAGKANFVAQGTYTPAAMKAPDDPEALNFAGVLAATSLTVSDHLIDTLTAKIDVTAADSAIRISGVEGKVAGGTLNGYVNIFTKTLPFSQPAVATTTGPRPERSTEPSGGYEAQFALKDADLAHLLLPAKATDEDRRTMGTAQVNATLGLMETFGPGGARQGRGELTLRNGNIYNVPLAMGLMQMVTLRLPVARSFREGEMVYAIKGDTIHFERILLESPGINLAGAGTVSFASKNMSLSFITETPNEFSIPILTPIIQQTRNELLQISVTGTVDNPKVTPVPFSSISNALKALLPRPRADAGR
jgi:hypothetical protein